MHNTYNVFLSLDEAGDSPWSWQSAPPGSGADIASKACLLNANGNLEQAFALAQQCSEQLQRLPGVEHAWAQRPGVVYVVLQSAHLLGLALQDYAAPWKASVPERWLLDYGIVSPFAPVDMTEARHAVLGDTMARALTHAGHKATRERLVYNTGAAVMDLVNAVKLHMQALEKNLPIDYNLPAGTPQKGSVRTPRRLPRGPLMDSLAQQALRMGVQSSDAVAIMDFSTATLMALQEEGFLRLRVEFDRIVQSGQGEEGMRNALDAWSRSGCTHKLDAATIFHGIAFGASRDFAAAKANGTPTYFTERVAHHGEQLNQGYERVVVFRDTNHQEVQRNTHLGLQALGLDDQRLSYALVGHVEQFSVRMARHKRQTTIDELIGKLGINGMRLKLLDGSRQRVLQFDPSNWEREALHLNRSIQNAYINAHAVVQEHFKGVASMQAGPVPHGAKPLLLTLLRWPQCLSASIEHCNPYRIYQHAMELVRCIHKTHANVPMRELDGAGWEAMGTAWSLAAFQLRRVLDILGVDPLEWPEPQKSIK